jgi:hypothetical protein
MIGVYCIELISLHIVSCGDLSSYIQYLYLSCNINAIDSLFSFLRLLLFLIGVFLSIFSEPSSGGSCSSVLIAPVPLTIVPVTPHRILAPRIHLHSKCL